MPDSIFFIVNPAVFCNTGAEMIPAEFNYTRHPAFAPPPPLTFMNTEAEIETLKQEVARLRREMDEYRQFIHYHPPAKDDDDLDCPAYLTIRCSILSVVNPSPPSETQINIIGSKLGAYLSLAGPDEKTRILLQVEKGWPELSLFSKSGQYGVTLGAQNGEGALDLYGQQGKVGVQMRVLGEAERGQVGVCEAGKARAIMKATETGAAISAVHDDGHARITLVSTLDNGELLAVTPDMKVGVKIAADGMDGGFITVNNRNGKAGVVLSNIGIGGAVVVNDHTGQMVASLPSTEEE